MTRDEIISMALEAGFDSVGASVSTWAGQHNITKELERFAALVAAAEREACADAVAGMAAGLPYPSHGHATAIQAVIAIRARGDK